MVEGEFRIVDLVTLAEANNYRILSEKLLSMQELDKLKAAPATNWLMVFLQDISTTNYHVYVYPCLPDSRLVSTVPVIKYNDRKRPDNLAEFIWLLSATKRCLTFSKKIEKSVAQQRPLTIRKGKALSYIDKGIYSN